MIEVATAQPSMQHMGPSCRASFPQIWVTPAVAGQAQSESINFGEGNITEAN